MADAKQSSVFGERVRARRAALGLTLAGLAAKAGMHLQAVAKIEAGRRPNPTWESVLALSKALEVSLSYFDPDQEPDPPARPRWKRK